MRLTETVLAVAAALAAPPAAAQLSNHAIAVESGISTSLGAASATGATLALSASTWLDGDLDGVARVAFGSAGGAEGRAAVPALAGTLGLRLSLRRAPLRPQVFAEGGWARVETARGPADRPAFGVGAALEIFPARDLSFAVRAALRVTGGAPALDAGVAFAGYF